MEYDGNDTQDHNLKVASEGTSKSSSVLRPYAFPRFDIDDSLQGHLRFDSLVETDAFLGIQSQADNQWIEDFSRERDVINFSSGATESCSVAKQNNVWSEAASLESVLMLLKSVGQEQIQPKDTVTENINTCNELRSLEREPKIEQDNAKGGSTRISNATILQNQLLNSFSAMEYHVEGKLSKAQEVSLSQESLIHGDKSLSQMCPNGLDNECKLPVAEKVVLTGTECDDRNMQVAECPIDVCLGLTGDALSPSAGPAQDINASSSILAPSPSPAHVSTHSEGADDFMRATVDSIKEQLVSQEVQAHTDTQIMEHHKLEDDLHTEVPCSYTSIADCVDKKPDIKVIINSNESSMMSHAQECQFELLEGRGGDNSLKSPYLPGKGETDILSTSKVMHVASTVSDSLTDNSEQHVTKLDNPSAAHCSNSDANMDPVGDVDQTLSSDEVDNMTEISHEEGVQGNSVLGSYSIKGENEPSKDKISNAKVVDPGESIKDLHDVSADDMVASRFSDCREDLQVEADQQCDARESENISVETKKEENVSLPTSVIDANPGTFIPFAPTPNSGDCSKRSEVQLDCNDSVLSKDPLKLEISSTIIRSDVLPPDDGKKKSDGGSEFAENKPSTSEDLKGKDTALDDNSFTFKVNLPLNAEREKANTWTPFPIAETYKSSVVLEGVTTPDIAKIQACLAQETSGNNPGDYTHGIPKATSGRRKRGSAKKVAKEILQGVNIEEITPDGPSHKEEKAFSVTLSPGANLSGQFVGSQPHGLTKHKSKKLSTKNAVPTSELPDLNASALKNHAAPSTAFYQTFTELQQLQLRAQIFVYGSLIQGTAPDEACMVSAFGPSDGGRGVWDRAWQAAVERVRRRKSLPGCQSPMSSHSSGAKVPNIAGKQVSPETVVPSSASRTASKGTSVANLSPIIPLSSPLWSISTPYPDVLQSSNLQRKPILHYQPAVSPRPPYHTPPVQNVTGHTTHPYHTPPVQNVIGHIPQQSQSPASPSPWVSQTFTSNVNVCFPTTSVAETVGLTPIKDFPLPVPSSVKVVHSPPLVYTDTTSTVFARSSRLPNQIKGSLSSEVQPSAESKPRRRKKSQPSDNTSQNPFLSQAKTETVVASSSLPTLTSPRTLVTTSPTCHVPKLMKDVFPAFSTSQPQAVSILDAGKACARLEKTVRKVKDAKVWAEEADVLASTAKSHCQSLWSQLPEQKSGMTWEAEVQVVALAGAAAAAASVAKAAAAAARVASSAALQAKLMANEAFNPTPMPMLTSDGGTNQSSSVVAGEKETAKRKIEAENLDSILEAAKLAGEAVSQAGKVVGMGEPLPLNELISSGLERYWKLPQASSELFQKSGDMNAKQVNKGSAQPAEISIKVFGGCPPGGKITDQGRILKEEPSVDSFGSNTRSTCGISESIGVGVGDKDPEVGKTYKSSDVVQSNRALSVLGSSSETVNIQNQHELNTVPGSNIKEGSAVEVYKDGGDLKPAWFSANVLTLHDGKSLVDYTCLLSKEVVSGSENHKEWVELEGEGDKAPRIRAALAMNASNSQGTRKRRRSAMGNHAWIVGDLVDVWIQDRWCEGVVTEKNEKDESSLTVHFPARGETSSVSTQQLRHSRIWTDGNWVQWSRLRGHDCSDESDMPHEKRPRLKSPFGNEAIVGKPEESTLQALSATDMVFNVGKNSKAKTKPDTRQTLKTGLQKDGSRGVFGVPKLGRKRKLVEVSKQFPAAQNMKDNESKDQVKFAKYLMPQGTTSRAGRNLSKVDYKERQSLRVTSLKPHSSSSRTMPQRDNVAISGFEDEKSGVRDEDSSKTASLTNRGSSGTYEAGKGPLGSSLKRSSSSTKPDLLNKEALTPAWGRLTKVDEEKVSDDKNGSVQSDVDEPRRSNRRIQPTHKLLEGLQSSMIIPKVTSISHDKGQSEKTRSTGALPRGK